MLIDTHCHLHDPEWFTPKQQADFLQDAHDNDVQKIICIGTDPQDSQVARDFAEAHEHVYWTYGIHPEFANDYRTTLSTALSIFSGHDVASARRCGGRASSSSAVASGDSLKDNSTADKNRLVAIGEIGLDYHYEGYDRDAQIKLFEQMLQLAQDFDLPVSLHIREAFEDTFAVLDNFPQTRGVVHSFTGSKKHLRQSLERGFYIGVNGLCTYTTNPLPPLERMLLETDAPFLTPAPFRGTINKPGYVHTIAAYLAEKLGVAETTIAEQTTQNARNIFQV